jgi:rod shape-determining protein MreD
MGPTVRVPVMVLGVLVVHDAVLRGLRIDGVRPDLLLAVAVVAAIVAGPERGLIVAFVAGIVGDLFLPTPFGLSALVWCVVAYVVGSLQATVLPHGRASLPIVTLVASAGAEVLYAAAGSVLGQPGMVTARLLTICVVVAVVNSLVSLPMARIVRWSLSGGEADTLARTPR